MYDNKLKETHENKKSATYKSKKKLLDFCTFISSFANVKSKFLKFPQFLLLLTNTEFLFWVIDSINVAIGCTVFY